jgi:hypothetical protein
MGRTIPSFRISSVMEEREWKSFRNSLDKSDRKIFDRCFRLAIYIIQLLLMLVNLSAYNQFLCPSYFTAINSLWNCLSEEIKKI